MYLLQTPKTSLAVILPPKTGTRSVEKSLVAIGAKRIRGRHAIDESRLATCDLIVSTIRHPCDILVSWYHYARKGAPAGTPFDVYLRKTFATDNGYLSYSTMQHAERASQYIRYEDGLEKSLNALLEPLVAGPVEVPHVGAAFDRKPWPEYYTSQLLELVGRRYAKDFERYGYKLHG